MYKKLLPNIIVAFTMLLMFSNESAVAQNIAINSTGTAAVASAGLDIDFTDKGLLIPRVALTSTTDATTISAPATSLMVYNTATAGVAPNNVTPGHYYWSGTAWIRQVSQTVERWYVTAANYAPGTYAITVAIPGVTTTSSAFVNLVGTWGGAPNATISHVETQTNQIRFRLVIGGATTYNGMDFMATIIR